MLSLVSASHAFVAQAARPLMRQATRNAPAPVMLAELEVPSAALASLPTTTLVADDTLLLASMVGSLVLVLGIVAAVVTRTLVNK